MKASRRRINPLRAQMDLLPRPQRAVVHRIARHRGRPLTDLCAEFNAHRTAKRALKRSLRAALREGRIARKCGQPVHGFRVSAKVEADIVQMSAAPTTIQ